MAFSITQTPATASLAQSPIVFTVFEDGEAVNESSSFQYVGELLYWDGLPSVSSSAERYEMVKFPNASDRGMFDFGKILNSTLTDAREANPSNVKFFKVNFSYEYRDVNNVLVSSSVVPSNTYSALDGYGIFQEQIGQPLYNKTPFYPMLTDGPAIQNYSDNNTGTIGVFVGNAGTGSLPTAAYYINSISNATINLASSLSAHSSASIEQIPAFPDEVGFPLTDDGISYIIQLYSGGTPYGLPIKFVYACPTKWGNVRVKWKNRFGQFDYFNFNGVNQQGFNTEKKVYQPQLGSWNGTSLQYQQWETSIQNYVVDSSQTLKVNTDFVSEAYNDIFKQLLVADEVYWIKEDEVIVPITIATSNFIFKTGRVEKLIQYTFDFNIGQAYKLIL
jgi:hypothetical protein